MALADGTPDPFEQWLGTWGQPVPEFDAFAPPPVEEPAPAPMPQQIGPASPAREESAGPVPTAAPQPVAPPPFEPVVEPGQLTLPDAVTGADAQALPSTELRDVDADIASGYIQPVGEQNLEGRVDALTDPNTSSEEFIKLRSAQEAKLQEERLRRETEVIRNDRERAEADENAYRTATAKAQQMAQDVEADFKKLSEEKLDSGRWWSNRSAPQKVAAFISAIVGGLVQARKGGSNIGLDMINQEIDRDIEEQKVNLTNKRADLSRKQGLVSEIYARTGDMNRAANTARLTMRESALRDLEVEMQKFDPMGTTALRIAGEIRAGRAQHAAELQKMFKEEQKHQLEVAKFGLDVNKFGLDVRKQDAAERKAAAGAAVDQVLTPGYFEALGLEPPPIPMTDKQHKSWLASGKASEELRKVRLENSPGERARQLGVGEIVDDQDDPVLFRNPEFAGKIAGSKGAVDNATRLIDKIILARKRHGWSSELLKSPEWREMQADYTALQLEKKTTDELGVLAGPDMDLIERSLGTKDPTEVRDPTPGLETARSNLVEQVNSKIRAQAVLPKGRKLKRYEPPRLTDAGAPKKAAGQDAVSALLKFDPDRPTNEESKEMGGVGKRMAGTADLPPTYKKAIDSLVNTFNDSNATPEDREQARAFLEQLGEKSKAGAVREYALRKAAAGVLSSAMSEGASQ